MTKWFNKPAPVDLTEEDLKDAVDNPVPVSILERTIDSVDVTLERCRAEERGRIWVQLDGIRLCSWNYDSRASEHAAMDAATGFVNGWKAREQMEKA